MKIPKVIREKILIARELSQQLNEVKLEINKWDFDIDAEEYDIDEEYNAYANNLSEAIQSFIDYGEPFNLYGKFKKTKRSKKRWMK